jgi:hypothetical protein
MPSGKSMACGVDWIMLESGLNAGDRATPHANRLEIDGQ